MAGDNPHTVTIVEVAALAGASPAAVSHVFNNRQGMVGRALRERILRAANDLSYRPNRRARQLRKQANLVISVQLDSSATSSNGWRPTIVFNLLMIQGINAYVSDHGYHLHMLIPDAGQDHLEIDRKIIRENAVDGLIAFGVPSMSDAQRRQLVDDLKRLRLPVVTLDSQLAALGVPRVSVDLQPGIHAAAGRIAELGHRRIGYVGRTPLLTVSEWISRFDLFCRAFAIHGLAFEETCIRPAGMEVEAYRQVRQMMTLPHRPTCLICTGDHLGMAAIEAVQDSGLRVPRDVSIVSFGNGPFVQASPVPLATIHQHHFDQGATLAKVLLDQIDHRQVKPAAVTLVGSSFVERDSLGPSPPA